MKRAEDGERVRRSPARADGQACVERARSKMSNSIVSAQEVDGQERPLGKATVQNGALVASVQGFGLKSYRVQLATTRILLPQPVSKPVALKYDLDVVSTDENDGDGAFEPGLSYPAEQFPKTLKTGGVTFNAGRDRRRGEERAGGERARGSRSRRATTGCTSSPPRRRTRRRPSRSGQERPAAFVPTWDGYVGQWDLRLWGGPQPEQAFDWRLPFVGLAPGFVKKAEVAWYASHTHHAGKGNGPYEYTYLFKQGFDVPKGATTFTLPNDQAVRVFALTLRQGHPRGDASPPRRCTTRWRITHGRRADGRRPRTTRTATARRCHRAAAVRAARTSLRYTPRRLASRPPTRRATRVRSSSTSPRRVGSPRRAAAPS